MASAGLAIAKASFSGTLFRADPTPCTRDQIEDALALLSSTAVQCSPANVQKCKKWALKNLVPSRGRVVSFANYLVALAGSFQPGSEASKSAVKEPSPKRKRLHLLYILNDILYHVHVRLGDAAFATQLESHLPALILSAASFQAAPKHIKKLHQLVSLWEEQSYFSQDTIATFRSAIDEGTTQQTRDGASTPGSKPSTAKPAQSVPFVLPSMHGDPSTPWYDLPAGNWLPVLEPNSTRPLNPDMIKPLQFASGPADKKLVEAVQTLLLDVDKLYTKDGSLDQPSINISQLGERIELDELGEVAAQDTYYGWSRAFCERMKSRRKNGSVDDARDRSRSSRSFASSRSRSVSPWSSPERPSSRNSSRPAFKRRRMSSATPPRGRNGGYSRDRGRSSSRSRSRSRNQSQVAEYTGDSRPTFHTRDHSRSKSPPRNASRPHYRSRSPNQAEPRPAFQSHVQSYAPSASGSTHALPPRPPQNVPPPAPPYGQLTPGFGSLPPLPQPNFSVGLPHPPPFPPNFHPPFPGPGHAPGPLPGSVPGLPPRPPSYQGQWPPPPPPLPPTPMGMHMPGSYGHAQAAPAFTGMWPLPPLPPQNAGGPYGGSRAPPGPYDQRRGEGRGGGRGGNNQRGW